MSFFNSYIFIYAEENVGTIKAYGIVKRKCEGVYNKIETHFTHFNPQVDTMKLIVINIHVVHGK